MKENTEAIWRLESQNIGDARSLKNHLAKHPLSKSHWIYRDQSCAQNLYQMPRDQDWSYTLFKQFLLVSVCLSIKQGGWRSSQLFFPALTFCKVELKTWSYCH